MPRLSEHARQVQRVYVRQQKKISNVNQEYQFQYSVVDLAIAGPDDKDLIDYDESSEDEE